MMELEFLKSEKGKDMLVFEGFLYNLKRVNKAEIIWICHRGSSSKISFLTETCQSVIKTNLQKNAILSEPTPHCHPGDQEIIQKRKIMMTVKQKEAIPPNFPNNSSADNSSGQFLRTIPQNSEIPLKPSA